MAEAGFEVVGLDISRVMLDEAREQATLAEARVQWVQGDICQVPMQASTFDVVLCLWLTFHELLDEREQLAALREMCRVLRPGGWALLDGPPYHDTNEDTDEHGELSFERLMKLVGIESYKLFVDDCPGRARQFLHFTNEATS